MPVENNIISDANFGTVINQINTNPPATPQNYIFNTNLAISGNVVVPEKLILEPIDGAMFVESDSGTLTFQGIGIAAEDIGPYAQVFSGFEPGDVKWGVQMPSEIYATWFGAKPMTGFHSGSTSIPTGYDTTPIMKAIQAAFTKSSHEGTSHTGEPSNVGTRVLFPIGDFAFSEEIAASHAYTIEGVENNYYWAKGTRFFFPKTSNGLVLNQISNVPLEGRTSGFVAKHFDIEFYGAAPAPISVTFASGRVTSAVVGAFAMPHVNKGFTITLPVSGWNVELEKSTDPAASGGDRIIDLLASSAQLSNINATGKYTRVSLPGITFTSANIGDTIYFADPWGKMTVITGFVNSTTVDIEPLEGFQAAPGISTETTVSIALPILVFRGSNVAFRPVRKLMNVPTGSNTFTGVTLDGVFLNSTFSLPGSTFTATVTGVSPLTLSAPIPAGYGALTTVQFTNLSGTANVILNRYAGVRAVFAEHSVFNNIKVKGCYGSGFLFDSLVYKIGNVDHALLETCKTDSCRGHGFHFIGTDTHEVKLLNFNAISNLSYGIYDETGTGMTVTGGHIAYNGGTVKQVGLVNQTVFKDIYTESGQLGAMLARHGMWIGGTNASGFQPDSEGALSLFAYNMRYGIASDGNGSQTRGARMGGFGLIGMSKDYQYSSRFWGDLPAATYPILSGASETRNTFNQELAADWSLYHSTEGLDIGTGYTKATGYYGAGFNVDRKSWHARRLEIGNGLDTSKTNYVPMICATDINSIPAGVYPTGSLVVNSAPTVGSLFGWRNIGTQGSPNWEEITLGSGGGATPPTFGDNFNRANGAIDNNWTRFSTGYFGSNLKANPASIVSNKLVFEYTGREAFKRSATYVNTKTELTYSVAPGGGAGGVFLFARMQDELNGYCATYQGNTPVNKIYKLVSGGLVALSSALTRAPQAGDVMRFTVNGSTLLFQIVNSSGTVLDSVTVADSTYSAAGFNAFGEEYGGTTVDDFKIYEL